MHIHVDDVYHDHDSPLHRLDVRARVVVTFALILLIALTPMGAFGAYIGFFGLAMVGALLAQLDPWQVVKRSFVAIPFALAALTLIFTVPGPAIAHLPLLGWPISAPGLIRFVSILFKSVISLQIAVLLMLTTPFTDLLWALGALRVPRVLVAVISFMYRYLFLLADEALRQTRARDARSAVVSDDGRPGLLFRAQTTGRMIGALMLRSLDRSERVYRAMLARGYDGRMRQLETTPIRAADIIAAAAAILIGAGIVTASLL